MRPRPITRNQPTRSGKIDKKQRHDKKSRNLKTDESVLKQSVQTCVNGLDKVIKVLENGSEEVVNFLSNECSIIYECRICSSLFRSLANFIAHKRVYCRKKFVDIHKIQDGQIAEKMVSMSADFQKGILSSRSTSRRDIVNFLDTLQLSTATTEKITPDLFAVELEATQEALFHCFRHEGKHCSEERSATLGPDGRILINGSENEEGAVNNNDRSNSPTNFISEDSVSHLPCPHCPKKFPSERALQTHCKTSHNLIVRTCYACPCCKKYLSNTWSVYRHLSKVHKKTNEQIRKLRPQINKKQVTGEELNKLKQQPLPSAQEVIKSFEEELSNLQEEVSNESLHRCYVCGKRFDRRVAMLAHAQICRDKSIGMLATPPPTDRFKMNDNPEMVNKRPRLDSPSPPPVTKSGIEVRMYYEKNKSLTTPPSPNGGNGSNSPESMHLKPTALALLASMPTARVVLTKTPVPNPTPPRTSITTPSPPPSITLSPHPTTSREFSPRAEDIISRYRGRQNLNQLFENDLLSSSSGKVDVECVNCSDTEDSNSGCEYVFGASDIAKCIGTMDSIDLLYLNNSNLSQMDQSRIIGASLDNTIIPGNVNNGEGSFRTYIKEEPDSEEEQSELNGKYEETQETDSLPQREGIEQGAELKENNKENKKEEESRLENGQEEDPLLAHGGNNSDSDETCDDQSAADNSEQEEEDEEDDDEGSSVGDDKLLTREVSLIKEQALNGLIKNGSHPAFINGIHSPYRSRRANGKINSFIDNIKKRCLLCQKTFHHPNLVRRHVSSHLNIFNFKCMIDTCDFKCLLRADMLRHLSKVHKKMEASLCRRFYLKRTLSSFNRNENTKVPYAHLNSIYPPNHNLIKSTEQSVNNSSTKNLDIIPVREKFLVGFVSPLPMSRTSNISEDNNVLSTSIDLEMNNGEKAMHNMKDQEGSSLSSMESVKEFHTTNMQMYDTDLDELIINPDADSNDDKLRALMMQVIFGSGGARQSSDQVSECGSDSLVETTDNSPNPILVEASSTDVSGVVSTQ